MPTHFQVGFMHLLFYILYPPPYPPSIMNCLKTDHSTLIMASVNGSPANTPQPSSDFDFDSTFTDVAIVVKYAEQYTGGLGLKVRHQAKSYFISKDWPFSTPLPEVKVPLHGWILCSPKTKSTGRDSGSNCNWKLVYKCSI